MTFKIGDLVYTCDGCGDPIRSEGVFRVISVTGWSNVPGYPLVLQNDEAGIITETTMTRAMLVSEADAQNDGQDYWSA
jgi:hypothetical protein